jgi:hypothetical protein
MLGSFQILDDGQPRRRDDDAMFWRGLPHGCASRPRASWSVRVGRPIRPLPVWDCVISSGQLTTVANSGLLKRPSNPLLDAAMRAGLPILLGRLSPVASEPCSR